jgi:hypothetical protein
MVSVHISSASDRWFKPYLECVRSLNQAPISSASDRWFKPYLECVRSLVQAPISSASDRWFKPLSLVSQIVVSSLYRVESKPIKFVQCICCFSAQHAALRRKIKDGLVRNQHNVSEWGDMSIRRLLFQ